MEVPTWLFSTLIGVGGFLVALIGGVIVRDRQIFRSMRAGDDRLHERINEVRDQYVRRSDLDSHIVRLDQSMDRVSTELREHRKELNQRLDAVVALLTKSLHRP
ncbi:hypothetical protein [Roseibium sp. Sym1]|uniref:hypothetical protein n=1 Tax=Roseibium sp. Sym1 TaxID=3016006 RepID=UPI0022B51E2F|nr:hypothetical protein [Roseibium sp. Sym1]